MASWQELNRWQLALLQHLMREARSFNQDSGRMPQLADAALDYSRAVRALARAERKR